VRPSPLTGRRIVTASADRTACLWDAATGQEIIALRGHEGGVQSATFSPDGARIVTASADRTARIWDATIGQEIIALRGHEHWVSSASFSPDGARIVTASIDCTARLWDATTGQEIIALRGHEGGLQSAAFSSDGARIVTASSDNTARLWDATTGREITRIILDAWVTGLSVHGGMIALGDALGRIHVFDSEEFLIGKRFSQWLTPRIQSSRFSSFIWRQQRRSATVGQIGRSVLAAECGKVAGGGGSMRISPARRSHLPIAVSTVQTESTSDF